MKKFEFANSQFGHYQVHEMLDKGGMALVYRALDQRDNSIVALKVLYPYLLTDNDALKRFQREAAIVQSLDHPHIVALRDFGEIDSHFYLAMRYMAGGSLHRMYLSTSIFDLDYTLKILKQIASALDYAHARGVIHRDMKLENILLDENGDAALSDFGIARVVGGTRYTITGQIAGTPQYMSPEQAQGKRDIDHRVDVYSLAVMAYRMTTGSFPFYGDDALAILNQHVSEMPPSASAINTTLPRNVDYVLWQGLAKNPADRFASAGEFVCAFERSFSSPAHTHIDIKSTQEMALVSSSTMVASMTAVVNPAPPPRKARKPRWLWAALTLLALCVLSISALAYQQFAAPVAPETSAPVADNNALNPETSPTPRTRATSTPDATTTPRPTSIPATFTPSSIPPSSTPLPPTPVPASPTPEPPTQQPIISDVVPTVENIVPGLLP
ncbi:MAG: serine/threonine-protein kinase [Anaerolineae bacterium]